ncbi:MAG: phosphonate ABC transporter, permease protein PhnE [Alphaproteobacteria bacterium]|nr:phosphonate ABC transporter, permease protein PhnE [Alphaproteobacteria bacterium]MCB9930819.1 phosphonate ABC transporter, permease protein PhnE [Alphaproteobacteria bacterium]
MSDAVSRLSPEAARLLAPRWGHFAKQATWALVLVALLGLAYYPAEVFNWPLLITDAGNMAVFAKDFLHPDFADWDVFLTKMLETVGIALWGTVLSILFGVPLALLASGNIAPWWVVQPVRRLMDAARAINEIVFAILFVAAVGLGPFAGVMALFVHNLGIISKLFSEAVEAIDPRPVEGIRATGAGRVQEVIYGVIPQVLPLWSSLSLYRFETNVRSATVLGIVGAGGIGFTFYESFRAFQYDRAGAIIIVVVVAVSLIDMVSARLRRLLI